MAKSSQGFIVVLPGEIIEIAQDDDISWLTLFYALPKELVEKYPDALKIPRCPYRFCTREAMVPWRKAIC